MSHTLTPTALKYSLERESLAPVGYQRKEPSAGHIQLFSPPVFKGLWLSQRLGTR